MRPVSEFFLRISAKSYLWLLIAIMAVGLCALNEYLPENGRPLPGDEWLRDQFVQLRAKDRAEERLALIDIDDHSISVLGAAPWPRERIADLIEKLITEFDVRGVALDIYFEEHKDTVGDQRLAALAEHGPVVLAQAFDFDKNKQTPARNGQLTGGKSIAAFSQPELASMARATGYIANHSGLSKARYVSNIGFVPDLDGTLRRIPVQTRFEGKVYSELSRALLECCSKLNANQLFAHKSRFSDVDENGFSRVEYSRTLSSYEVVPALSVLQDTVPLEALRGKYIIIGSSSLALADRVPTPLWYSTSGFLVHAQALSTMLDEHEGRSYVKWPGRLIALLFTVLTAGMAMFMFPRFSAWTNTLMLGLASATWVALAYLVVDHDMWFSPVGPLAANFFLLAVAVPFGWQTAQRKSRRLLGTLQQYVAKAVVQELLRSDLKDPLAPRQLHVTTLIADMEGYTSQVENLPMEGAANLTREFLECLTGPVLAKGGTLDKYTGDGLVAFWGAPLPVENHADLALDAAIEIVRNVRKLSAQYEQQGRKKIRVRIGIESGIAIAGDFGSSFRSIYTAVGDSVNTASRLEDAARHYPHDIIIGKGTVEGSTRHQFQALGERLLKGKEKPTTIYTVEVTA
ncbi:CHASE2 domain-containing protein [Undibacterium sp. Tian12W]|uniref:CHASE2 domain-containing protein n=1 Tax=Undibacterium sp. Tian12W TaxID=3413054 RepID=UPI003BF3DFC7